MKFFAPFWALLFVWSSSGEVRAQGCPGLGDGGCEITNPCDPNEKVGPSGWSDARHVRILDGAYTIFFENQPSAQVPAQEVVITDVLPPGLDGTTIRLGDISFGSQVVADLIGKRAGQTSVPLLGTPYVVEVTATFEEGANRVRWMLRTVDPKTGDFPEDDNAGLLPPNDATGRGEGHVSFTVQPLAGLATGTQIGNSASIVFDTNAAIVTNTWLNTIDSGAPSSQVTAVVPAEGGVTNQWTVYWTGSDDSGGCGLSRYTVFMSEDGGPYSVWHAETATTQADFVSTCGHTYAFYTTATDNVGNVETAPVGPDRTLDPGGDADLDFICDLNDNCPNTYNPTQKDSDRNGTGDVCDVNATIRVSSNPGDPAEYRTIQGAVNGVAQSGTTIQIAAGQGYTENVVVDQTKSVIFVGDSTAGEVVVKGGEGLAFDVRSTAGGKPTLFKNLTIEGSSGIRSSVGTQLEDVEFRSISGIALELLSGAHMGDRLRFGPSVANAIRVAPGAQLTLRRGWFDGVTGIGLRTEGEAHLVNALMVNGGTAIRTGTGGSLDVRFATIAQNTTGIDNSAGATVAVDQSIVYGNSSGDVPGVLCASLSFSDTGATGCAGQNGNISAPCAFDSGFHLTPPSPCVDAGDLPARYIGQPPVDLDGDKRLRDFDGDGLAKADLGAFEATNGALTPVEVSSLRWTSRSNMVWDAAAGATEYHVYRGNLRGAVDVLSYSYFGTCHDELDQNRADTSLTDNTAPGPGTGWFFLITPYDGSATDPKLKEGTLGFGTSVERTNYTSCVP